MNSLLFRRMEKSFPATPMSDSRLRLEGSSISELKQNIIKYKINLSYIEE